MVAASATLDIRYSLAPLADIKIFKKFGAIKNKAAVKIIKIVLDEGFMIFDIGYWILGINDNVT